MTSMIFHTHSVAFGGFASHAMHLGCSRLLLEAGAVGASADQAFGPVLLMKTQVVDKLLLDLEGLATLLTLVPTVGSRSRGR